jgi:hypothetical protein
MHLHLIMRFFYYMHLHLLRSVLAWCGAVRFGVVRFGVVLRFELDSFGSDWASPNVNLNLKNLPLQQLKNLANYSIQI